MTNLEKYFLEHTQEFDTEEPAYGHFQRFETRLKKQGGFSPGVQRFAMIRVAAIVLLLIAMGVLALELATKGIVEQLDIRSSKTILPQEINDAVQYYDFQVARKMARLHALASDSKEAQWLDIKAKMEMKNLEQSAIELKKCLSENPGNERVFAALIQNQQMKEGVMNNLIQQLAQIRNQ